MIITYSTNEGVQKFYSVSDEDFAHWFVCACLFVCPLTKEELLLYYRNKIIGGIINPKIRTCARREILTT